MTNRYIWYKIGKIIESCKTWDQLNVCRNMLDTAVKQLYIPYGTEYYKDLSKKILNRRSEIEDVEDKELLERMNAEIESKKTSS